MEDEAVHTHFLVSSTHRTDLMDQERIILTGTERAQRRDEPAVTFEALSCIAKTGPTTNVEFRVIEYFPDPFCAVWEHNSGDGENLIAYGLRTVRSRCQRDNAISHVVEVEMGIRILDVVPLAFCDDLCNLFLALLYSF